MKKKFPSAITRQLSFLKSANQFGGSLLVGKRKEARPLSTKSPIHLILKSEKARGIFSFINHRSAIELAIAKLSARFGVRVFDKSVNNNHIHFIIQFTSRSAYKAWVRTLTAEIVRIIARQTKQRLQDFFTYRPFTKIVTLGRQFQIALDYIVLNQMEYFGLRTAKVGRRGRKNRNIKRLKTP